jgi:hypothetical protein
MRLRLVLVALLAGAPCALAQQSLFESGNGQTAVYLRQSTAAVNLGDSKASLGYVHRVNIEKYSWGVEGYATANAGVASLFSSNKPTAPEGGGDGTLVRHYLFTKPPQVGSSSGGPIREDWLLVDAGYGRSSFYVYPTGAKPSTSTPKTDFDRFRALLAYNFFANGNMILGIAAGAERRNNLSDLTAASLETVEAPAGAGSASSVVKTQAGYYGNYKEYVGAPIYTDALFYLPEKMTIPGFDNRVGVDLLTRSDAAAVNRSASGGIGIFLFKKSDPLTAVGGLTATYDGTKFQVSLTAGISGSK